MSVLLAAAASTSLPLESFAGLTPGRLYPGTSSSANDSAGLPRRNFGRFASLAPLSDTGTFDALVAFDLASPGLESVGFDAAGGWLEVGEGEFAGG